MKNRMEAFERKRDFLICVDSDGCAMDTMDIKHIRCFGPYMIEEWGLEPWREQLLKRWNEINLYSKTRGVNRFKALVTLLKEVDREIRPVEGLKALCRWAEESGELSNASLEAAVEGEEESQRDALKKALSWSRKVNEGIEGISEDEKRAFPNVKKALGILHKRADIAVISSANLQAVTAEWEKEGLLELVDGVFTQNDGSKAFCIGELMKKGYKPHQALMAGDAPGDLQAAETNHILYFPILVGREGESWERLLTEGADAFFDGRYAGAFQEARIREFWENLEEK